MVNIKEATQKNLDIIIDLGELLQKESAIFENDIIYNRQEAYSHYLNELSNPNARIIIAVESEQIIGYQYSFIEDLKYLSTNSLLCTLEALYVLPDSRNNGIGSRLLEEAERWAVEDMKVNRLKANIYTGNVASENLHTNNGFEPHSIEYVKKV